MITLLKDSPSIKLLCQLSKLIKGENDASNAYLSLDAANHYLTFNIFGQNRVAMSFRLDSNCFTFTAGKKTELAFSPVSFFQLIASNLNKDIEIDIDNGFSIKIGKKLIKLTSVDTGVAPPGIPIVDLAPIKVEDLARIVNYSNVISTKNSVCIFNNHDVLTVDSVSRQSLCVVKMLNAIPGVYNTSIVDPNGTNKTVTIPINIACHYKDITTVVKVLTTLTDAGWGDNATLLGKVPQYATLSSVGYELSDPTFSKIKVQIFHPLIDDHLYNKEVKTIGLINKFKSTHKIELNRAVFDNVISNAFFASPQSAIHLSNKANNKVIVVETHDKSYHDEIELESSDCIFELNVRSDILNSLISSSKGEKTTEVTLLLNNSMPALCKESNAGLYFVSCLSNSPTGVSFEVKDIPKPVVEKKDEAPAVNS